MLGGGPVIRWRSVLALAAMLAAAALWVCSVRPIGSQRGSLARRLRPVSRLSRVPAAAMAGAAAEP